MDEMKTTVRTLTFSTNYVPRPPLPRKVGGHDPSSYGSAAPVLIYTEAINFFIAVFVTV